MSSEEFEKLHEIFSSMFEELKLIPDRAARSQGEERKRLVRTFDERHGEAEEVLQGMEEELRGAPTSYRNGMSTKLRLYRRDLGKLQRDMKNSAPGFGSSAQPVGGDSPAVPENLAPPGHRVSEQRQSEHRAQPTHRRRDGEHRCRHHRGAGGAAGAAGPHQEQIGDHRRKPQSKSKDPSCHVSAADDKQVAAKCYHYNGAGDPGRCGLPEVLPKITVPTSEESQAPDPRAKP